MAGARAFARGAPCGSSIDACAYQRASWAPNEDDFRFTFVLSMSLPASRVPTQRRGKRLLLLTGAVLVIALAAEATWRFAWNRDPIYDDDKAFADRLRSMPAEVSVPEDVMLPTASGGSPLPAKDLVLIVSKRQIRFPISHFTLDVPEDASHGVEAKYKNGPKDLYIVPLARAEEWAFQKLEEQKRGRLTLLLDGRTPYRLLVEVLFTSGQTRVSHFTLTVRSGEKLLGFTTDRQSVPHDAGAPTKPPTFGPTVIVVNDGFSVKARGGNVAPGCSETGVGLAVGKVNGDYDYDQLKVCVAKVKKLSPDLASETHLVIAADPGIPIQAIISVIDAVRKGPAGEVLFPDPLFGLLAGDPTRNDVSDVPDPPARRP
jgi:hypothetical protein